jgi:hypothetical protein
MAQLEIPFPRENGRTLFLDDCGGVLDASIFCDWEGLYPSIEIVNAENPSNSTSGNNYPILEDSNFFKGATSNGSNVRIIYPGVYTLTVCSEHNRIPGDQRNQSRGESSITEQQDDHNCTEILIANPEPAITQGLPLRRPKPPSGDSTESAAQ